MAKDYRKEISFQAGELSPRFYGRTETEFYQKGLAIAKNVTIDKRGGAFRRGGARNRGQVAGNDCRVLTKQIHPHRFDTILIYDTEMMVIAPGIDFQSANLLSNGKFDDDSAWTVAQDSSASRAIFTSRVCKLKPQQDNGEQKVSIQQEATVTAGTGDSHTIRVQQAKSKILTVRIGTTQGGSEIDEFYTNDELFEATFTPNNATYWVEIEANGEDTDEAVLVHVGTLATADIGGLGATYTAPWAENQLEDIHFVRTPSGDNLYFFHPNVAPEELAYDFSTDTYTALAAISFTSAPSEWTGTNWPATGTHFQGRLWAGGTPNEPQTIWASQSGSDTDFTTGAGAADSFDFTVEKQGRIKWLLGTKELVVGTENAEHIVVAEDGVITQSDIKVQQQSAYGSNQIQAVQVGEKIFYITPDGRKVQSMAYAWQENNWLSQDLTFASEHITTPIARRRTWAQNPDSHYTLVMEDGTLATLTYDRTAQTIAWTDIEHDGNAIIDVAVGQIGGVSRHVFAGQRTADEIEIEIEISETIFLDSFTQEYYDTASDAISGLDHLEGEEVQVVVDGAVTEPQTVSSGAVTAAVTGNVLYAGKMIESKITTLPPDVAQEQIRSWIKRWNKVYALMHESAPPIINGVRPPDRSPSTPMDTPEPLSSRAFKVVTLGYDRNGQVNIEENLPVPMNILAVYGELSREAIG